MNEDERARFYEEHQDDPDVWEEVEVAARTPRKTGLNATITVRFPPEEAAGIRAFAKQNDLSYSDVVRKAVQNLIRPSFSYDAGRLDFQLYRPGVPVTREDSVVFPNAHLPTSTGHPVKAV
jgi:hypothetical protein